MVYMWFQDFQVDVYFRQRLTDHRLAFDGQDTPVILSAKSLEKVSLIYPCWSQWILRSQIGTQRQSPFMVTFFMFFNKSETWQDVKKIIYNSLIYLILYRFGLEIYSWLELMQNI